MSNRNLVCSGCYSKIPQTGWLVKDRNLVLTVLEAGSPRSGSSEGEFWWQPSSGLQTANVLLGPHIAGGEKELSGFFYKGTNPVHGAPPSWPHHLPKPPPPDTITLAIAFQHMNFGVGGDDKHSVCSTKYSVGINNKLLYYVQVLLPFSMRWSKYGKAQTAVYIQVQDLQAFIMSLPLFSLWAWSVSK